MNGRRGRSPGLEGTALWTLGPNGGGAQGLDYCALPAIGGFASIPATLAAARGCRLAELAFQPQSRLYDRRCGIDENAPSR